MPGVTCLYGRVLRYEEKRAGRTWKIASHHTHLSAQKNLIKHCCCCFWAPNLCETHIANGVASPPPVATDAAADVVEVTVEVEGNRVSGGRESPPPPPPPPPPPGEDEEGDPGPGPKGPELSNLAKKIENAGMKYLHVS